MLFRDQLSLKYRIRNWIGDLWNRFDVAMYVVFLVSVALRFLLSSADLDFRWVRALYSAALVLSYLRLLQFFYAVRSMGPKVIMIQKMVSRDCLFIYCLSLRRFCRRQQIPENVHIVLFSPELNIVHC